MVIIHSDREGGDCGLESWKVIGQTAQPSRVLGMDLEARFRLEELAQFNQHQQDARGRLDTLAKSIFLLAGGDLTLSINAFTGIGSAPIEQDLVTYLQVSWSLLFYSMVAFLLVIASVLLDMYVFGERWRKQLDGGPDAKHFKIEVFQIILAATALLAFILGFASMSIVAMGMVSS